METETETIPRPPATDPLTRYYLIGVKVGSHADRVTARLVHGLNNDRIPGLVDHTEVIAPTLSYAMTKIAYLHGLLEGLYLHLYAYMTHVKHKKSAS